MSRPPAPLPSHLTGEPFTTAEAAAAGVSRGRTRARDLRSPFHGVRVPAGEISLVAACRARLKPLRDDAVISHITAARLHSLPLPLLLARAQIIHVSVPAGRRAPVGRTTVGHQVVLTPADCQFRHGIPCTTPERTFCDLAAMLDVAQLVAVGDHLVHHGIVGRGALADAVNAYPGRRGRANLRRALDLLDEGSESPKESELRVLLIEAGFTRPVANRVVRDEHGRFVARVDLSYPDLKIAIEYEGDHHREKIPWRADLARRRRLEALGWIYLPVTQADLERPEDLFSDLRSAISRRLAANGR